MPNQPFELNQPAQSTIWKTSRAVLITSLVVTATVVGIRQFGGLQSLELNGFDQFVRLQPDRGPDDRLLIVGITEEDIKNRNEYPLTDSTITELLDKLEQAEPQAIGLDIIRDVPQPKGDQKGHAALIEFLQASDRTVVVCKTSDTNNPGFSAPPLLKEQAETQVGAVNLGVDPDGITRRALLTITPAKATQSVPTATSNLCDHPPNPDNPVVPYFGLQLALMYLAETQNITPAQTSSGHLKLDTTVFQPLESYAGPYRSSEIGGRQGYQLLIDYRSPDQVAKQVSLTEVLSGKVDPQLIKDRIVLIGYTARSVHDEFLTPYGQATRPPMPGVVAHAQVISQILSQVLDQRPQFWFLPGWAEVVWIFGWSFVGGILTWKLRRLVYLLPAIAIGLITLYIICWSLFSLTAGWIPLVPSLLAFLLTATGVVFFSRGYAKAVYQSVKGLLPDIGIDQAKKERDIAEITGTDFFGEMERKAKKIRRDRTKSPAIEKPVDPIVLPASVHDSIPLASQSSDSDELDYLNQLQRRGEGMRQRQPQTPVLNEQPTSTVQATQPQPANEQTEPVQLASVTEVTVMPELMADLQIPTSPNLPPTPPLTINPSEFDFLPPFPSQNPSQSIPSHAAVIQLHREVDEYYQQLKRQRQTGSRE